MSINTKTHKKTRCLRDCINVKLLLPIARRVLRRGHENDNLLDWPEDCVVADSCIKLSRATEAFIKQCITDDEVVDTRVIWDAIAHQCCIYAYS